MTFLRLPGGKALLKPGGVHLDKPRTVGGTAVSLIGVGTLYFEGNTGSRTIPLSGTGWTSINGSVAAGDAIFLLWENYGNNSVWSTPTGWTQQAYLQPGGNTNETALTTRNSAVTSGEASGGSYTATIPSTWNNTRLVSLVFRNVNVASPLDGSATTEGANPGTVAPVTVYAPAVTPTGSGGYVVQAVQCKTPNAGTWGSDFAGMSSIYKVAENTSTSWFVQGVQTDSAVARHSTTITANDYLGYTGISFVVKAA